MSTFKKKEKVLFQGYLHPSPHLDSKAEFLGWGWGGVQENVLGQEVLGL